MAALVNDRIDVRISKEHKDLIKYASELSGFKSVSEFIVNVVSRESKKIVQEDSKILKSLEDKKIFVNAILNPPEMTSWLIFVRYGKRLHGSLKAWVSKPLFYGKVLS